MTKKQSISGHSIQEEALKRMKQYDDEVQITVIFIICNYREIVKGK